MGIPDGVHGTKAVRYHTKKWLTYKGSLKSTLNAEQGYAEVVKTRHSSGSATWYELKVYKETVDGYVICYRSKARIFF